MEHALEISIIGAEVLCLGYCLRSYFNTKSSLKRLEDVKQINVGTQLADALKEANGKIPYASLRGNVVSLSPAIHSFSTPQVTGVVQKVTVKEHVVSQSKAGFWIDHKRPINTIVNSVPFAIQALEGASKVEVLEPLSAEVLDLEVVADRYDSEPSSFFQSLWQFATGFRKQGVQTKEQMLKEGTFITVVGEVLGKGDNLTVGPPTCENAPYFISTLPLVSLIRRVESQVGDLKAISIGLGVITFATFTWFFYRKIRDWFIKKRERRRLDDSRRNRRARVRNIEELTPENTCIVCQTNPREVILLPCGHVCLCEDCSVQIPRECPTCRSTITSRHQAFIS